MLAEQWRDLWAESRHRAHVIAVSNDVALGRPVFCLVSAAVLHRYPLYRVMPRRVHVVVADADRRSAPDVFRHEGSLAPTDVVEVDGILCTSPERTVHDLARLASAEVALACADAALGAVGGDVRHFDDDAVESLRDSLRARASVPAVRGIRQARTLVELADGRAQLPLESTTRLQLLRLGFRRPRLQVRVPAPEGGSYWLDIEIEEANSFYECDGEAKYLEPGLRNGRTAEEVVIDEKRREDWVRGTTNRRVLRGGSRDAVSADALAARLSRFGVVLPQRPPHPFLPTRPLMYGI
ncbi:MAG: hypothetical protein QM611_00110 [Microbacterium sp.]|uniref:hypothetical protein n=1 Tax=Microbacterium sp. TaxID=51671 RepID=UPI0039E30750